jgi:hypothetical protein
VTRDPGFHHRGYAQRQMNSAQIVPCEIQCHFRGMVLLISAKGVRQSVETVDSHFHIGSAAPSKPSGGPVKLVLMALLSTRAKLLPKGALHRLASGLEAGVIGGVAMLLLLVAGSMWRGEVWWAPANLLGSTFYGRRAFRAGPGLATISGTAFHIVITGTVGALFGLACGGVQERRRLVMLGTLAGVFWYYLADALFWSNVNVLVPAYAPQPATLLAHALFGACLGYMGQTLSRTNQGPENQVFDAAIVPAVGPIPSLEASPVAASAAQPPPLPVTESAGPEMDRPEQDRMRIG